VRYPNPKPVGRLLTIAVVPYLIKSWHLAPLGNPRLESKITLSTLDKPILRYGGLHRRLM
jgi:hypothetical protein